MDTIVILPMEKSFLEEIQVLFLLEEKTKKTTTTTKTQYIVKRSASKTSSKYLAGTMFETIPSYSLQVESITVQG